MSSFENSNTSILLKIQSITFISLKRWSWKICQKLINQYSSQQMRVKFVNNCSSKIINWINVKLRKHQYFNSLEESKYNIHFIKRMILEHLSETDKSIFESTKFECTSLKYLVNKYACLNCSPLYSTLLRIQLTQLLSWVKKFI